MERIYFDRVKYTFNDIYGIKIKTSAVLRNILYIFFYNEIIENFA